MHKKLFEAVVTKKSWSSAEGQAGFFASSKCFSQMVDARMTFESQISLSKKVENCTSSVCSHIVPAALSVGRVFASLKSDWRNPNPNKSSSVVVNETEYRHPDPQCRFDTYIACGKCTLESEIDFDNVDYKVGACHKDYWPRAARPKCWFTPSSY